MIPFPETFCDFNFQLKHANRSDCISLRIWICLWNVIWRPGYTWNNILIIWLNVLVACPERRCTEQGRLCRFLLIMLFKVLILSFEFERNPEFGCWSKWKLRLLLYSARCSSFSGARQVEFCSFFSSGIDFTSYRGELELWALDAKINWVQ